MPSGGPKPLMRTSIRLLGLVIPSVGMETGGRFQYSPLRLPPGTAGAVVIARPDGTSTTGAVIWKRPIVLLLTVAPLTRRWKLAPPCTEGSGFPEWFRLVPVPSLVQSPLK